MAVVHPDPVPTDNATPSPVRRGGPARRLSDLVAAYVQDQVTVLRQHDAELRVGERAVIHPTRVAARRLRSVLRVYRAVFEPAARDGLETELRWFAHRLGEVRDLDVLAGHLESSLAEVPAEQVLGPVSARIQESISLDRQRAVAELREAVTSDRYRELAAELERWRTDPPFTAAAQRKPARAKHDLAKAQRTADRRLAEAGTDEDAWHRARRAGKRLRYAAELAQPVVKGAKKTARRSEKFQTRLGDYQDAMVAAHYLAQLGAQAGSTPGHNGYTYGVLASNELHRAAVIRATLPSRR